MLSTLIKNVFVNSFLKLEMHKLYAILVHLCKCKDEDEDENENEGEGELDERTFLIIVLML